MSRNFKDIVKDFQHALNISYQNTRNIVKVSERYLAELAEAEQSGGSSDYSTDEHVVGKWIDGTTDVYEKTQNGGVTFSGSSLQDTSITNVAKVISVVGTVLRDNEPIALGFFNTELATSWICRGGVIKVNITNQTGGESTSSIVFDNITVRYIKQS